MAKTAEACPLNVPTDLSMYCIPSSEFYDKLPTLGEEFGDDWTEVGCLENLNLNQTKTTKDIYCLGTLDKIAQIVTSRAKNLTFGVKCWDPESVSLGFGGGVWKSYDGGATACLENLDKSINKGFVLEWTSRVVDAPDPKDCVPVTYRLLIPCATITSEPSLNFGTAGAINELIMDMEVEILDAPADPTVNPNGQACKMQTDDPLALAAAA